MALKANTDARPSEAPTRSPAEALRDLDSMVSMLTEDTETQDPKVWTGQLMESVEDDQRAILQRSPQARELVRAAFNAAAIRNRNLKGQDIERAEVGEQARQRARAGGIVVPTTKGRKVEGITFGDVLAATVSPSAFSLAQKGGADWDNPRWVGALLTDLGLNVASIVVPELAAQRMTQAGKGLAAAGATRAAAEAALGTGGMAAQAGLAGENIDPGMALLAGATPGVLAGVSGGAVRGTGAIVEQTGKQAQKIGGGMPAAAVEGAGRTIKEAPEAVGRFVRADVKRSADFADVERTAAEIGMEGKQMPAALEFGFDSPAAALERRQAQVDDAVRNNYVEWGTALDEGVAKVISDISPDLQMKTLEDAGNLIRDKVLERLDNIGEAAGITFRQVAREAKDAGTPILSGPDVTRRLDGVLEGMDEMAAEMMESELSSNRANGQRLRSVVSEVLRARTTDTAGRATYDYETLNKVRETLRREAFAPQNQTELMDETLKQMRRAYRDVSETMLGALEEIDPKKAEDLREANEWLTGMLTARDQLTAAIGKPGKSGNLVFAAATANPAQLAALQKFLDTDSWNAVRSAVVHNKLVQNAAQIKPGLSWSRIEKELRKGSEGLLLPDEQEKLMRYLKQRFQLGETVRAGEYLGAGVEGGFGQQLRDILATGLRKQRIETAQAYARGQEAAKSGTTILPIIKKEIETGRGEAIPRAAGSVRGIAQRGGASAANLGLVPAPFGYRWEGQDNGR